MKQHLYQLMIELSNGRTTSAMLKRFATSSLSRNAIQGFTKTYNIELQDLNTPVSQYRSLHDFFIRQIKPEARPISQADIVSPVDGRIEILGPIRAGACFTVKGNDYSLAQLLGSEKAAEPYEDGQYAILYLSPADYHRIHSPVQGKVVKQYMLGEKSYPVNRLGLTYGKTPISGNRRLITELETPSGRVLVVKVGAMYINSIELTEFGERWKKGAEVGYFSFGSTVAVFFEGSAFQFDGEIKPGDRIKVGEPLAYMI